MIEHQDLDLLTVAEAAELLKVSTVTVDRWVKQGRLPACRVGPRRVCIRRADLVAVMEPVRNEKAGLTSEAAHISVAVVARPLTEHELSERWKVFEESQASIDRQRMERSGRPLSSSVPIIRKSRADRSRQLLE